MRLRLLLCLVLVGCTRPADTCGHRVLTLWPSSSGNYEFKTVQLDTLGSAEKLEGAAARIYSQNVLGAHGFEGSPAEPHLTKASGDVCVPRDTESAVAVNAYAQFEALYHFERDIGTSTQIAWPRSVGVNIKLQASDADAFNNAHYYGVQDAIAIVPYTKDGLPISFNQGVIAHEHFHAHFQALVTVPMDAALRSPPATLDLDQMFGPLGARPIAVADTANVDLATAAGLNNFVLRGWNEGMADFFAAIYTGQSDIFAPSLNVAMRNLDGELRSMRAADDLTYLAEQRRYDHAYKLKQLTGAAYAEGTVLARFLYVLAKLDPQGPRAFLTRMMDRLSRLAPTFVRSYRAKRLDYADVLLVLLENYPLKPMACLKLKVVDPQATPAEYPSCARIFSSL